MAIGAKVGAKAGARLGAWYNSYLPASLGPEWSFAPDMICFRIDAYLILSLYDRQSASFILFVDSLIPSFLSSIW